MKKKWWHDKVAYQIYPKSFCDSNGDGIGDLRGIIGKLDYLKDLGVDIIWISPVYCSPMKDQGYDISDYYNINPIFGTMEDMEELLKEAKKRGLYVLMDLVVNHCSSEHEWFRKALKDPDGKYGQYFYIREGKDGKAPNNWRGNFGGSAWERIGDTDKYYLHTFHETQPDLNWENPALRQEIYEMINWWLQKGLAGFRIDAIINIKKEPHFRSYTPDREDGTCSIRTMLEEAQGIGTFLTELRENTFDKYGAFTVGEVFDNKPEELGDFIGEEGYFSTMFDFSIEVARTGDNWYEMKELTPEEIKKIVFESQRISQEQGFMANIIENHDEPRGASAFFAEDPNCEESKTMLAMIQLLLRGIPFIYQGQEIGMTNVAFESMEQVDDISTKDQYQVALDAGYSPKEALEIVSRRSRDNCRTPFQWNGGKNAGFTEGTPWLLVNSNYTEINLESQLQDEYSVYAFYKKLIHLRKEAAYRETLVYGRFSPAYEECHNIFAFYREREGQRIAVIANYQKDPQDIRLRDEVRKILLNNYRNLDIREDCLHLEGYQAVAMLLGEKNEASIV